ncbi:MAG: AI-2E family transporter [Actinomycetota bacterium]|nr:AI-2E family transporter [Actinomycetota bacterium]
MAIGRRLLRRKPPARPSGLAEVDSTPRSTPVVEAPDPPLQPQRQRREPRPLSHHPLVRGGTYAWAILGVLVLSVTVLFAIGRLTVVVIPLVLALFPAAVLAPPAQLLKRRGLPDAAAALIVLLAALGLLAGLSTLLTPQVASQLEDLSEQLETGYRRARQFLESGPLGLDPVPVDDMIANARDRLAAEGGEVGSRVLEAGIVVLEGFTGLILGLFALFFYLKDGEKIAGWLRSLFSRRLRADVQQIGDQVWFTIGAYIRGLLVIGLVDATAIGIGLVVLRIPLALPLAVLVFFGALFPIVGAFLAGTVAVLVALATNGVPAALAVLILILVVQQVEGHLLTPILLGRATALHPLAVIAALTAGGVLLGVLGAFLAVPLTASAARAIGYLRERTPG